MRRRHKPTANPSKIATLVDYYNRGLLTKEELLRLKREALGINVYTGKAKSNGKSNDNVSSRDLSFSSSIDRNAK